MFCKNDNASVCRDMVNMVNGSAFSGLLAKFNGSIRYYGASYPFPLNSPTHQKSFPLGNYTAWSAQIYLTPISTAGGVVINKGTHFATLVMYQAGTNINGGGDMSTATFTWKLYANNNVVVPIGGCGVSSRNVVVNLPEYQASASLSLSIYCTRSQNISYYLTGTTDTSTSIFANMFSGVNAAKGVGIPLVRNGNPISANQNVQLGKVGTSAINLDLSARYARTKGQVTAGKVQSVIGVTFTYD
nr:fimbrial protein [Providencia sneebia]